MANFCNWTIRHTIMTCLVFCLFWCRCLIRLAVEPKEYILYTTITLKTTCSCYPDGGCFFNVREKAKVFLFIYFCFVLKMTGKNMMMIRDVRTCSLGDPWVRLCLVPSSYISCVWSKVYFCYRRRSSLKGRKTQDGAQELDPSRFQANPYSRYFYWRETWLTLVYIVYRTKAQPT